MMLCAGGGTKGGRAREGALLFVYDGDLLAPFRSSGVDGQGAWRGWGRERSEGGCREGAVRGRVRVLWNCTSEGAMHIRKTLSRTTEQALSAA